MKVLAIILGILASAVCQGQILPQIFHPAPMGGGSTWTLVQYKNASSDGQGTGGGTCNTSTCSMAISAPGSGHLIFMLDGMSQSSSTTLTSVTVAGQTFTHCPSTGGQASSGWFDCWYTLSSSSNATTSATCTPSQTTAYQGCAYVEYAWSGSSITLDNAPAVGTDASCSTCAAVALTAAGTDLAFQAIIPANSCTAISDGTYSNPANFFGTDGLGNAGKLNASGSLTTPNWTCTAGVATVFGITFEGH